MTRIILILFLTVLAATTLISCSADQTDTLNLDEAKAELEELLGDFLQGASVNDADMHERFWADELIYTSSSGERMTKEDIMSGFEPDTSENSEPTPEYGYEDLQIMVYNDVAVVAFRLVARLGTGVDLDVMNYYNTGTFIRRNGQWRAVAWQATRIPQAQE